ncbi:MAG: sensor histidine kinase [Bdellovibrio sp.]|nr:MAG: sensor histidine kinase [Bdellovibrio sp.]
MNKIQSRLRLFLALSLSLFFGFSFLLYTSFMSYKTLSRQLEDSYHLQGLLTHPKSKEFLQEANHFVLKAQPPHRKQLLQQTLNTLNKRTLTPKERNILNRSEHSFQKVLKNKTQYLEKRIFYFSLITFFSMLLGILSFYRITVYSVLKPLHDLSMKMRDFLNNKYSYKFSVPPHNEVGQIQSTFNALAQKVLNQIEELKALDKAKSEFLSIASHELRTPLTSIKGSLGLLKGGVVDKLSEPSLNLVSIAEQETDRLIRLINDLLDLAKIEAKKFPLKKEWTPLIPLLEQTQKTMEGLAHAAQVSIKLDTDLNHISIFVDKERIQQVLTNLISNAIKYTPPQSQVTLRAFIDEDNLLTIEVSDQGKGIAPEDQELIFEQFRQVTSEDSPLVKGTGLGLAIAKALIDEHGGSIGVQSMPNKGATFYFKLHDWKEEPHEEGAIAS